MTISPRFATSLADCERKACHAWRAGRRNGGALYLTCQHLRRRYRAPSVAAIKRQAEVMA